MTEGVDAVQILMTFGGIFLLGLLADLAGRHTPLPRVTLLLLAGFAVGPSMLDWLPDFTHDWFPLPTNIALAMIGFLLGEQMTRAKLGQLGRPVLAMSLGEVLSTAIHVFTVLTLFGVRIEVAGPIITRWTLVQTHDIEIRAEG